MSITRQDVHHVALLARLRLSEAEEVEFAAQLGNILEYFDALASLDTTGVEPMSHAQDVTLRLRDDRVTEHDQHQLFQSIAPQVEDGLYLVPKVIE